MEVIRKIFIISVKDFSFIIFSVLLLLFDLSLPSCCFIWFLLLSSNVVSFDFIKNMLISFCFTMWLSTASSQWLFPLLWKYILILWILQNFWRPVLQSQKPGFYISDFIALIHFSLIQNCSSFDSFDLSHLSCFTI